MDGTIRSAAENAQRQATNFARSLQVPVYLQDERLTSVEAKESLLLEGHNEEEIPVLIDGEAAALILRDFLNSTERRVRVSLDCSLPTGTKTD
jgi:putative transcription antitermination factor YqgF